MESPHEVLGVDADADEEAIDRAYRRRVFETHPDHGGSLREFQRVRGAYEELTAAERSAAPGLALDPDEPAAAGVPGDHGGPDQLSESRVEYLDYEALADHGWSLDDPDLFEKAATAGLDPVDYGTFPVDPGETVLEAAEGCGFAWPYSCRGGACANCAVAVTDGEVEMPLNHVLSEDLMDRGIRLSCIGTPSTDELRVVYNVKHLPDVEDLLLPAGPFREAQLND